jgi:hypothetical protein
LPSALLQTRQRRAAAGKGLGTGLGNTATYVRRTASGAAGNGLGTTIKYLRRTRNGAAGDRLASTTKYLRGAASIGLGSTIKCRAKCLCVENELPSCVHKQNPHQHTFSFDSAAQNNIPI